LIDNGKPQGKFSDKIEIVQKIVMETWELYHTRGVDRDGNYWWFRKSFGRIVGKSLVGGREYPCYTVEMRLSIETGRAFTAFPRV
jgi:hypothetical protein